LVGATTGGVAARDTSGAQDPELTRAAVLAAHVWLLGALGGNPWLRARVSRALRWWTALSLGLLAAALALLALTELVHVPLSPDCWLAALCTSTIVATVLGTRWRSSICIASYVAIVWFLPHAFGGAWEASVGAPQSEPSSSLLTSSPEASLTCWFAVSIAIALFLAALIVRRSNIR